MVRNGRSRQKGKMFSAFLFILFFFFFDFYLVFENKEEKYEQFVNNKISERFCFVFISFSFFRTPVRACVRATVRAKSIRLRARRYENSFSQASSFQRDSEVVESS